MGNIGKRVALLVYLVVGLALGTVCQDAYAQGSIEASFVDTKGDSFAAPLGGSVWCSPTSGGASVHADFSAGALATTITSAAANTYTCSVYLSEGVKTHVGLRTTSFAVQNGVAAATSIKFVPLDASFTVSVLDQFGASPSLANPTGTLSCNNWQNGINITTTFSSLPVSLSAVSGYDLSCSLGTFSGVGAGGWVYFNGKLSSGESKDISATAYKTDATLQVSVLDQLGNPATFSGTPAVNCYSRDLPFMSFQASGASMPLALPVVSGFSYSCSVWGLTGHVAQYASQQVPVVEAGSNTSVTIVAPKPDGTITVNFTAGGAPLLVPAAINVGCSERKSGGNGLYLSGTVAQNASSVAIPSLSDRSYYCFVSSEPAGYGRLDYSKEVTLSPGSSGAVTFAFESLQASLNVQLVASENGAAFPVPDGSWVSVSCSSEGGSGRYRYYSRSISPGQSAVTMPVKEGVQYKCRASGISTRAQVTEITVTPGAGGATPVQIPLKAYDSAVEVSFVTVSGEPVTPIVPADSYASVSCSNADLYVSRPIQSGVATVSLPVFSGDTYSCYAYGNLEGFGLTSNFAVSMPSGAASKQTSVTVYPRAATIEMQTLLLGADGSSSKFERSYNGGYGYFSCYGTSTDFSFEARLPNGAQPATLAVVPGKYRCSANSPEGFVAVQEEGPAITAVAGQTASAVQYFRALTGTLNIRLVDENGAPLTVPPDNSLGISVYPKDGTFWLNSSFTIDEQESESSGAVVPGKTYLVNLDDSYPGYARPLGETEVTVPESGSATATVALRKLNAAINVTLVGPDGQPYPVPAESSAWVDCWSDIYSGNGSIDQEQVSTSLAVLGSATQPYLCNAWIEGLPTKSTTVTVESGATATAQIEVLSLNSPVTVQLVDAVSGAPFNGVAGVDVGFYSINESVGHSVSFAIASDTGAASTKLVGGNPYSMWASISNSVIDGVFELNGKSYILLDRSLNLNPAAGQETVIKLRILEAKATLTATLVDGSGNPVPGWISAQTGAVSDDAPGIGAAVPASGTVKIPVGVGQTYFVRAYGYGDSPISAAVFSTTPSEGQDIAHTFVIPTANHILSVTPSTSDGKAAYYSCNAKNELGMQTWGYQEYLSSTIQLYMTTGNVWTIRCEGSFYENGVGTEYGVDPISYSPVGALASLNVVLSPKGSFSRLTSTVSSSEKANLAVSTGSSLVIDPGALGNGDIEVEVETRAPLASGNIPPETEAVGSLTISANNGGQPLGQFARSITAEFLVDEGGDFSATHCTDATSCTQLPVNSVTPQGFSKLGVPTAQVRRKFAAERGAMAAKYLVKVAVSKPGQLAIARKKITSVAPTPAPTPGISPTPSVSVGAVGNLKVKVNRKDRSATATWTVPSGHTSANYTLTLSWKEGKKSKRKVVKTTKTSYVFKKLKPLRYQLSLSAAVSSISGPASSKSFAIK